MIDTSRIGARGWSKWQLQPDEWRRELLGMRGIKTRREMARSPYGGAIRRAIEQAYRRLVWHVEPGGETSADQAAAEFLETCLDDLNAPWSTFVNQVVANVVEQGFALFETIYKRRVKGLGNKQDDKRVGWDGIELRTADTIDEWDVPVGKSWQGVWQSTQEIGRVYLPKEKLLLFRLDDRTGSPLGSGGIFDDAYRAYYFVRELQNIEAIIEERMGGIPKVKLPPGASLSQSDPASDWSKARDIIERFKADEMMGFVVPDGYEVELLNPGEGARRINETINAHKQDFFLSVLAQWALLGTQQVGSWALSKDQSDFFVMALTGWMTPIRDVLNNVAIPRLFALNAFAGLTALPQLAHSPITKREVDTLATALSDFTKAGWLVPRIEDEVFLRAEFGLPEVPEDVEKQAEEDRKRAQEDANKVESEKPEGNTEGEQAQPAQHATRRSELFAAPSGSDDTRWIDNLEDEFQEMAAMTTRRLARDLAAEDDQQRREEIIAAALALLRLRMRERLRRAYYDVWVDATGGAPDWEAEMEVERRLIEQYQYIDNSLLPDLRARVNDDLSGTAEQNKNERETAVAAGIAAFLARIGMYAGSAWALFVLARIWQNRHASVMARWAGPADSRTCPPCQAQVAAGARLLSETPLPGAGVCRGLTRCRHIIEIQQPDGSWQ